MVELEYETSPNPSSLSIDESGAEETVILVPPLPQWRQWVLTCLVGLLMLAMMWGVWRGIVGNRGVGIGMSLLLELIFPLFILIYCIFVFVILITDRKATHEIRVTKDSLYVRRTSTAGLTIGNWSRRELQSVGINRGSDSAKRGRNAALLLTLANARIVELLVGHPVDEIRQIAAAICRRMGMAEGDRPLEAPGSTSMPTAAPRG